jgi:hypothetical protein
LLQVPLAGSVVRRPAEATNQPRQAGYHVRAAWKQAMRPGGVPPASGSQSGTERLTYCPAALKATICMTQVPFCGAVAL